MSFFIKFSVYTEILQESLKDYKYLHRVTRNTSFAISLIFFLIALPPSQINNQSLFTRPFTVRVCVCVCVCVCVNSFFHTSFRSYGACLTQHVPWCLTCLAGHVLLVRCQGFGTGCLWAANYLLTDYTCLVL